ncbi:hypothetical protein [Aurantiacibacter rhizosphaerae]|uniref:Uncharacterized protein n=1 Tax=Aurantiacibacter rhizosphaerae TaxID=2691582 RepID=A0A844XEI4_9SPHN|nr:hypothetical protein [Aurantiacibacter rhizosphaerae]MWV28426.1 hypothetical protein [Aurantiacibacter rhizosphaerae]
MSMSKPIAQMRISTDIKQAEYAVDEALLRQGALMATLITTRRETGSGPAMGHDALLRLVKSQQDLLSAGGELARVHGSLLKIQQDVLGYEECPEGGPMELNAGEPVQAVA